MTFDRWDIWLADVPFEDIRASKLRPVLVIDARHAIVLAGKMTSHPPRDNYPHEYAVIDWAGSGLHVPTTIRLSQILRLDEGRFRKRIGTLSPVDIVNVYRILTDELNMDIE